MSRSTELLNQSGVDFNRRRRMGTKYILQYGSIAGISYSNARSLISIGIKSQNIIPSELDSAGTDQKDFDRQLPFDRALHSQSTGKILRLLYRLRFFLQTIGECSLVHYHGFANILPRFLDASIYKNLKKPMIVSWAGGDVRIISEARKDNPFFYRMPDEAWDERIRSKLELISRYVRYVATDPEMMEYCLPYFEKVFIVHQPIRLEDCKYIVPDRDNQSPVILHLPTHREVKGTSYIEAAIKRLKTEGLSFEFRLLPPIFTQKQVREKIAEADIYIDELRCGSYGMTAVEAMTSGKPTVVYIREDLVEKYPAELPLVNANPETIYQRLKELILDAEMRHEIGLRSRKYIEKYHSLEVVGTRLLQIYSEIGWKDE